jgi:hypothetical protein
LLVVVVLDIQPVVAVVLVDIEPPQVLQAVAQAQRLTWVF